MLKRLNVILLCMLILLSSLFMTSCNSTVNIEGIENFGEADSSVSLTKYLIPNEEFLDEYEYVYGDYYYLEEKPFVEENLEIAIMILEYEQDVYEKAKQYCISKLYLSDENVREYAGFTFAENLDLPKAYNYLENGKNKEFPCFFNMFGYNDEKCTIVSIGFHCGDDWAEEAQNADADFSKFIETFYSEYYNFAG